MGWACSASKRRDTAGCVSCHTGEAKGSRVDSQAHRMALSASKRKVRLAACCDTWMRLQGLG